MVMVHRLCRRVDGNRLETAVKRRIPFRCAVLIDGRRADALKLAADKAANKDIGFIQGSFGTARAPIV